MKIGIASDHHGVAKRKKIVEYLKNLNYEIIDLGPEEDKSVDYPTYAFSLAELIKQEKLDCGILLCGTGIGMSIAANKVKNIRCARITSIKDAKLCKEHNNANIIAFSANIRFSKMIKMVKTFLNTKCSTEERHIKRINMINDYNG